MFGHRQAAQVAELSAQSRLARAATTEYQHPSHAPMMPARTAHDAQAVAPCRPGVRRLGLLEDLPGGVNDLLAVGFAWGCPIPWSTALDR
jgi:hypothetical protein